MAAPILVRGHLPHKTAYVYELQDPRTNEARYVGVTTKPTRRLAGHISHAKNRLRTWVERWINGLLHEGVRPVLVVLEVVPAGPGWIDAEQRWIALRRAEGCKLTNLTIGGDGTYGLVLSDAQREARRRLSTGRRHSDASVELMRVLAKVRGISPEIRAKMQQARRRNGLSPETLARMVENGKTARLGQTHTAETKERMRVARLANPSGSAGKLGAENRWARAVIVDGVHYATVTAAAQALGLKQPAISQRLRRGRGAAYAE